VWRYDHDGKRKSYGSHVGLLGSAIKNRSILIITNPMQEAKFNSMVDIETTMPILVVPIKCSHTKKILGAFEVINANCIEGLSTTGKAKLSSR
jgi:hypothetical protein